MKKVDYLESQLLIAKAKVEVALEITTPGSWIAIKLLQAEIIEIGRQLMKAQLHGD